jgi:photosystem II stability/assembly factor-like uncharacterized protein
MKTRHLLFLLFIQFYITEFKGQANWSIISQPGENLIIVNQTTGYTFKNEAVGSHGYKYTLKKSTDGFQSFSTIKSETGDFGCYMLDELYFIDADTGFIGIMCQGLVSIHKTIDGGQTWTQSSLGGTYGLSMDFLSLNNGYYSYRPGGGNNSYLKKNENIIYTTNKYILTKDNYQLPLTTTKIKFLNDSIGFIICKDTLNNAVILKTTNFGYSWVEKKNINNNLFKDIYFTSDSIGFVVGTNGCILRTNDFGENWQTITSNTINNLNSIDFANDNTGYIVGDNGEILKTQNLGLNWSSEHFNNSSDLIYVRSFLNGNVFINDNNGNLYNNQVNSIIKIDSNDNLIVQPNPTSDYINILISPEMKNYKICLFNMLGEKLLTTTENQINLERINYGEYIIMITTENQIYHSKIIKQ